MTTPEPSKDLHQRVRAGFIVQGTTLKAWCRANGVVDNNVRRALYGSWNGPRAKEIRRQVVKAARIQGANV